LSTSRAKTALEIVLALALVVVRLGIQYAGPGSEGRHTGGTTGNIVVALSSALSLRSFLVANHEKVTR